MRGLRGFRRWLPILLACVFVAELIGATAVAARPHHDHVGAESAPLVVGDRTVRLVGLGGAGSGGVSSGIAANIGTAVSDVERFWGTDWSREISVLIAGSDEQFRTAVGGGPAVQWADIAAVTVADRVDPARRVAVGQRIVFAPGAARMSALALRIVLTHELFHYAARADTALDAPRWFTEGVADYVARPDTAIPAEAASGVRRLPSDTDLDTPGPQRSLAYDRAWWFARFVAHAYGTAKLRELYLAACGVRHAELSTAIRDVLGVEPDALLAAWQRWLAQ